MPNELREAAYALGVPKWRTILKVVIPTSISGIASGITLAIARVIGETAPLLIAVGFTTGVNLQPCSTAGWRRCRCSSTTPTPPRACPAAVHRPRVDRGAGADHPRDAAQPAGARSSPACSPQDPLGSELVARAPASEEHHEQAHRRREPERLLRLIPRRRGRDDDDPAADRHRLHRPVRLWQVHVPAHPQPHARGHPRRAGRGQVLLDGRDLYGPGVDPVGVRRQVGMVFQRPNPFPTMSIYDNVLAGMKLNNSEGQEPVLDDLVERSLRGANLWNEVKDRLDKPGSGLSGGQQQRLCIARAIAVQPDVLLMDEPCSALDPISTLAIEDLINELKKEYTIVIVTHNMQQAARVSDTPGSSTSTARASRAGSSRSTRPGRSSRTRREGDRGLRVGPLRLLPLAAAPAGVSGARHGATLSAMCCHDDVALDLPPAVIEMVARYRRMRAEQGVGWGEEAFPDMFRCALRPPRPGLRRVRRLRRLGRGGAGGRRRGRPGRARAGDGRAGRRAHRAHGAARRVVPARRRRSTSCSIDGRSRPRRRRRRRGGAGAGRRGRAAHGRRRRADRRHLWRGPVHGRRRGPRRRGNAPAREPARRPLVHHRRDRWCLVRRGVPASGTPTTARSSTPIPTRRTSPFRPVRCTSSPPAGSSSRAWRSTSRRAWRRP